MSHRRTPGRLVACAAMIAGLAGTLLSLPASADTPMVAAAPPAIAVTPDQDCATVRRQAAEALAPGRTGTAICVRSAGRRQSGPDGVGISAACPRNSQYMTRSTTCTNEDFVLDVYAIPSGTWLAEIDFSIETVNTLNYNSLRWSHTLTYTPIRLLGTPAAYITETLFAARPECWSPCRVVGANIVSGPAVPGFVHRGSATLESAHNGVLAPWHASSTWRFWFFNPNWIRPYSNELTMTPPAHRCDDTLGAATSAGCVYANAEARHFIGRYRYPKYARHIQLSISHGLPSVLTRTTNQAIRDANRQVACGGHEGTGGQSCDEYPFASTLQGAASQPYGRTFLIINWNTGAEPFVCGVNWVPIRRSGDSGGYSVCMIPLTENLGGGSDLQNFYYTNRVIDRDNFSVEVTY